MSVAKVVELTATSKKGFEDAITSGISRAAKTLTNVRGAWVKAMKVEVDKGQVVRYRVSLKVTFVLEE